MHISLSYSATTPTCHTVSWLLYHLLPLAPTVHLWLSCCFMYLQGMTLCVLVNTGAALTFSCASHLLFAAVYWPAQPDVSSNKQHHTSIYFWLWQNAFYPLTNSCSLGKGWGMLQKPCTGVKHRWPALQNSGGTVLFKEIILKPWLVWKFILVLCTTLCHVLTWELAILEGKFDNTLNIVFFKKNCSQS